MSEVKFTPGPLLASTVMVGRHHYLAIMADGPSFKDEDEQPYHPLIAAVYHGRVHAPRDIAEANAHLFAAAPDLYAALENMRSQFEIALRISAQGTGEDFKNNSDLKKMDAALAKARGEHD